MSLLLSCSYYAKEERCDEKKKGQAPKLCLPLDVILSLQSLDTPLQRQCCNYPLVQVQR